MTLLDLWTTLKTNSAEITVGIIILCSLIQIVPVKLNPWSLILKGIRFVCSGDVASKVDKLADTVEQDKAVSVRYRILRFDDEIRVGTKHSKEHFQQILMDADFYEQYCEEHPFFRNNVATLAISDIKSVYKKCCQTNNFI